MMRGSFQDFITGFKQMAANPAQYMISRGIPQEIANDPDAIIQKMMSEGRISQSQYNAARNTAAQIQNNPMFREMFGGKQ